VADQIASSGSEAVRSASSPDCAVSADQHQVRDVGADDQQHRPTAPNSIRSGVRTPPTRCDAADTTASEGLKRAVVFLLQSPGDGADV
jgi:hypothetical protein